MKQLVTGAIALDLLTFHKAHSPLQSVDKIPYGEQNVCGDIFAVFVDTLDVFQ